MLIINHRSQKAARAGVCDEDLDTVTIRDRYRYNASVLLAFARLREL